jgi:hypothetical protein
MNYSLHGRISAEICGDCLAGGASGFLRLYDGQKQLDSLRNAPKDALQIVSDRDLSQLGQQLAREPLGEDGSYKIGIDDRQQGYQGGALIAVLEVPYMAPMKGPEKKHPTMYIVLAVFQPEWGNSDRLPSFLWDFRISYAIWCRLMALFDVWCICGRIVDCKTKRPLVGLTVKAMDADVIKDDFLGQADTDAQGYFKICYRSIDFKHTFLSPIINVETPFGGDLGPDVYFIVESAGAAVYTETRADGKKEGRKDRSNCWCVELCIDAIPGDGDDDNPIRAIWTNVGTYLIPDDSNLNDFDAQGYGGAYKYGFFSVLPLEGVVKRYSTTGNPMQWRFMVSDTTADNGAAAVPAGAFSPVTPAAGTFGNFTVGKMIRPFFPSYKVVTIDVTEADVDAAGWISLEKAINRTFTDDPYGVGISPANLATETWYFEDNALLMHLNSGALTTAHAVPAYAKAGVQVNPADYWPIEKVAIRFECREDLGGGSYAESLGNGRTLNSIVLSNDGIFAALEVKNAVGDTIYCAEFNEQPTLAYSVYHPHLSAVSLNLDQNGPSGYNANQSDPLVAPFEIPFTNPNARPGITSVGGLVTINPPITETCIYIAALSYGLRLTTGRYNWSGGPTYAYFFFKI